jgi:hypothetical protein
MSTTSRRSPSIPSVSTTWPGRRNPSFTSRPWSTWGFTWASSYLEDLFAACAEDGVYAFLLVAPPLYLPRAVGTPLNPIAIK